MKSNLLDARMRYLRTNVLSYEDVINLTEDQCVRVNSTYFHYLIAKAGLLKIKVEDYYNVFYKYLEIDNMQNFINGFKKNPSYYLMSATDIKYLVLLMGDIPKSKTTFLKSDVNVQELNEKHEKIRKQFLEKKENSNGKVWKKVENSEVPCEVKVTEKSGKLLAKILLK